MLLLFTGLMGAYASVRFRSENAFVPDTLKSATLNSSSCAASQEQTMATKTLALSYYAKKYSDTDVSVDVKPFGDHMEAYIRKNGVLVKKLSINGNVVAEEKTGLRDWAFELMTNVN